jgi:hypothetical protein
VAAASRVDPPIRHGSIVAVPGCNLIGRFTPDDGYIGVVVPNPTWEPGIRLVSYPGIGEVEVALDKCYNATEEQRKKYFKLVLKHGT